MELAFIQDKLHHYARNQCQGNSSHEGIVEGFGRFSLVFKHLVDGHRCGHHVELQVFVSSGCSKDSLVHVLRVKGRDILRGNIEEVDYLVEIIFLRGFEDLVGAKAVRVRLAFVSCSVNLVIELIIRHISRVLYFKSLSRIRKHLRNVSAHHITICGAIAIGYVDRLFVHQNALLVGIEPCAEWPWRRLDKMNGACGQPQTEQDEDERDHDLT